MGASNLSDLINVATSQDLREILISLAWVCDIAFHKMADDILGPDVSDEEKDKYISGVVQQAQYEYTQGYHSEDNCRNH